jgi:hypothetical protein
LSNLVLTTTKAIGVYADGIGALCTETEVDDEDMRHKLSTGLFLKMEDLYWPMMCFGYKTGLIDEQGGIETNLFRDILKKAADKVVDICLKKSVDRKEDKNVKFLLCLRDHLPVFTSFL